ncbi:MAG: alpha/beta fold hydrolase [Flavobacteriaceae bacterium]|nr:alpha/beta fold hydrolase [Flavobacteriaceae bacterium]
MKTLLLLHGAIGAKDQLSPLAEDLRNHYEIHNLNFSGHGGCDFDSAFSIENFADEVLNYLNTMKIETASIFGYSMGGYVALYFASKHAERVEKIVTLATKFEWSPEISQKETKMLNPGIIKEKIPAFAKALQQRHHPQSWETVLKRTSQMMLDL